MSKDLEKTTKFKQNDIENLRVIVLFIYVQLFSVTSVFQTGQSDRV